MPGWGEFEREAPDFAGAARRRFVGSDGVAIGFLATASRDATPHLAPVCPIFADEGLYLSAAMRTPKVRDLFQTGRYVLHAFLGPNDEEFQFQGTASEVTSVAEKEKVHAAIPFGSFDASHPVFEFSIERALWVYWENAGQPDTRAIRRRWPEVSKP